MSTPKQIADIEERARSVGVSLSNALRRAGIHRATLSRWRNGNAEPMAHNFERFTREAERAIARAANRRGQ